MIGYYPINPAGSSVDEDAFGPRFFRTHFFDRMKQVCAADSQTPVLEIMLTSGQVLDVAHIIELKQDYMLINVFVDTRDCANTYNTYVRFMTIYRINVLTQPVEERPIGFNNREPEISIPAVPTKQKKAKEKKRAKKK
ncbi:MAG: hypothetical protein KDB90_13000 [Planctomycetes bacterium]|nr:hypothetical protein [Planctomycetota bacterium]